MYKGVFKLYNGVEVPGIALGTWQTPNDVAVSAVEVAIELGYTHLDTAIAYENEEGVAKGIKNSGIEREKLFVTTKIPAEVKSYEEAKEMILGSLKRLGTDYIDMMIIHAPKPWSIMHEKDGSRFFEENVQVYKALEEAYKDGVLRSIGLSNFGVVDIENIMKNCEVKPMVNQICTYIGNMPEDVIKYCQDNEILVTGYSPIATGRLLGNEQITEIADKYKVTLPQLCIRYLLERGILPLPKTVHKEYMKINADVDFEISKEDVEILNSYKNI
ncbi:MAG: aldo/keto reductase family protein [Lachnospirales bacterium]